MEEKEIHLRDYIRVINKRKNTVVTFFVLVVTVVIIASFTATPYYKASTKVMIEQHTSTALSGRYSYNPYDPEFLQTQYQIIKSASVADKVLKNFDTAKLYNAVFAKSGDQAKSAQLISTIKQWLREQYDTFKAMIGIKPSLSATEKVNSESLFSMNPLSEPISKEERLKRAIQAGISVEPVSESKIVILSYISDNPIIAMKIANSIAKAYIEELLDMRMEVSGYSIKWMAKKAEVEKKKLQESEKALQDYQKKHDIITIEDRVAVIPERLSELSRRLTTAETEKKELASIYNQIKNTRSSSLETIPAIASNLSINAIKKQITASEQKISELSKKFGKKHPAMISAYGELKGFRIKKANEIQKAIQTIRNQFQLAASNEENLRKLLEETKSEAVTLNEKYIQLNILKREVETNRYLYDALVKLMKEKGITEESQTVNVWIIEDAVLPKIPATPNKKKNFFWAVIVGILGGIGLAFFFEYLDNTVKSPEDIEERFDIPVIGTITMQKNMEKTKGESQPEPNGMVESIINESNPVLAENFKSLRTSIFLSAVDNLPKVLLVTSMSPGEGKSSISGCLALTIAKTGKKVLLIDADMRRPVQHKNFHLKNDSGLSTFLAKLNTQNVIRKKVFENLDIIPSGPVPPNPSELLSSNRMRKAIGKLADTYDMVIIDSPPIISVSDPLIISGYTHNVIIVTWAGSTTYEVLKKGLKLFKESAVSVNGIVLNRFDAKKTGYYYAYGYGDYYYSATPSSDDDADETSEAEDDNDVIT